MHNIYCLNLPSFSCFNKLYPIIGIIYSQPLCFTASAITLFTRTTLRVQCMTPQPCSWQLTTSKYLYAYGPVSSPLLISLPYQEFKYNNSLYSLSLFLTKIKNHQISKCLPQKSSSLAPSKCSSQPQTRLRLV